MANPNSRKQRQRRKAGKVKRVEFVLHADNERDRAIFEHLSRLTQAGAASEFIKSVLYQAIVGQGGTPPIPEPDPDTNIILAELAELKRELQRRPAAPALPANTPPPAMHDAGDLDAGQVVSSGLDTSRRRAGKPKAVSTPAPASESAPFDAQQSAARLLASIMSYAPQ